MNPEHPDWEILKAQTQSSYVGIGCGPGWDELIMMTHYSLYALDPGYRISQIKEKFGGLRYYFSTSEGLDEATRERMWKIEGLAGRLSESVCEECGAYGRPSNPSRSWIKTLCEDCLVEAQERRRAQWSE